MSRFVRRKFSCGSLVLRNGWSEPFGWWCAHQQKKKSKARSCERLQKIPSDRSDNSIIRAIGFSAPSIRSKLFRTTTNNEELLHPMVFNESSDIVAYARISVACDWCISESQFGDASENRHRYCRRFIKARRGHRSCR